MHRSSIAQVSAGGCRVHALEFSTKLFEAFNDINADIRLLQKSEQFDERCRNFIDKLQEKEKEKFQLVFNWYRKEATAVACGEEELPSHESIRPKISEIEETITEILYELRSICNE